MSTAADPRLDGGSRAGAATAPPSAHAPSGGGIVSPVVETTVAVPVAGRRPEIEEVLIVEDDPGDAFLAAEYIREQSDGETRAVTVDSVHRAVGAITSATSCVLLDLNLPDAVGVEGLQTLMQAAPSVPVVVLTGFGGRTEGLSALQAGAQDFLDKNAVTPEALWRSVRFAVERRRALEREYELLEMSLRREENRRLTRGLLPTPQVERPEVRWASRYLPARAGSVLGGDFIDAIELADGSVRAVVGDVSGHGPEQAALGVCLRIAWRTLVLAGSSQAETMRQLDRLLCLERTERSMFVTACDVAIAPQLRALTVCVAGHEPPVLLTGTDVEQVDVPLSPILGIGATDPRPATVPVPPAWRLLMFTDGITDGRRADGPGRLGVDGLCDVVREVANHGDGVDLLDHLLDTAQRHHGGPLPDDVALFLLSARGSA